MFLCVSGYIQEIIENTIHGTIAWQNDHVWASFSADGESDSTHDVVAGAVVVIVLLSLFRDAAAVDTAVGSCRQSLHVFWQASCLRRPLCLIRPPPWVVEEQRV